MFKILGAVCMGLLLISTGAAAEEYDEVHPCDEYAAHPNDPNRWAKGVPDFEIIPGPAVKFCREAVREYGDVPRFQFQLGRALWAAHKFEEGLKVFLALEEGSEYAPVYAYLGDAYMTGLGGIEVDEELAVSLYQIADEEGFLPAGEVLAALSGEELPGTVPESASLTPPTENSIEKASTTIQQNQPSPAPQEIVFDRSIFLEPDIVVGLHDGNFSKLKRGKDKYVGIDYGTVYIRGFISQFAETVNFRDPNCINIHDPSLEKMLEYKLLQSVPGIGGLMLGGQGSLEDNLNAGAMQGFKIWGDMLKGMHSGQGMVGGLMREKQSMALLKDNGEADATRLILRHGCDSEIVRRIYANAAAYVKGQEPIMTAEEKKRREVRKQREIEEAKAENLKKLQSAATQSCVSQFKENSYCGCLIQGLREETIKESEWKRLGKSFREIIAIGKNYASFKAKMKECRSRRG